MSHKHDVRLVWDQVSRTVRTAQLPDNRYSVSIRHDSMNCYMSVWFKQTPSYLGDKVLEFAVRANHPDLDDLITGFCEKAWVKFQPEPHYNWDRRRR